MRRRRSARLCSLRRLCLGVAAAAAASAIAATALRDPPRHRHGAPQRGVVGGLAAAGGRSAVRTPPPQPPQPPQPLPACAARNATWLVGRAPADWLAAAESSAGLQSVLTAGGTDVAAVAGGAAVTRCAGAGLTPVARLPVCGRSAPVIAVFRAPARAARDMVLRRGSPPLSRLAPVRCTSRCCCRWLQRWPLPPAPTSRQTAPRAC
eukprot:TRINITY_DN5697_c3_g1_i1.p2 TRINITY_DN5697_c3_g1~~TRINITY_DN5697_c3_g1_i1.p2  ORF type:complete len:207 (+),score=54.88 TRINITY_DN5697_c3_g1_i1:111-731(+)